MIPLPVPDDDLPQELYELLLDPRPHSDPELVAAVAQLGVAAIAAVLLLAWSAPALLRSRRGERPRALALPAVVGLGLVAFETLSRCVPGADEWIASLVMSVATLAAIVAYLAVLALVITSPVTIPAILEGLVHRFAQRRRRPVTTAPPTEQEASP